jgi:hypothetical protein
MHSFDYVLAVALLSAPPEAPEPALSPERFADLRPTLQKLAVQWEILDPREVRYVLVRAEDFGTDLKLLRRRQRDLVDAPNLSDGQRFPERTAISDLLAFNRSYRQHIDNRQAVEVVHWWELREAVQEADRLYHLWDTARDARCDYYYVTVRRQALKRLREMLGDESYAAGQLPPHVPLWRFQKID